MVFYDWLKCSIHYRTTCLNIRLDKPNTAYLDERNNNLLNNSNMKPTYCFLHH